MVICRPPYQTSPNYFFPFPIYTQQIYELNDYRRTRHQQHKKTTSPIHQYRYNRSEQSIAQLRNEIQYLSQRSAQDGTTVLNLALSITRKTPYGLTQPNSDLQQSVQ